MLAPAKIEISSAVALDTERPWTAEEIKARNEQSWKLLEAYVARTGETSFNINRMDELDPSNLLTEDEERAADYAFDRSREAQGHR